MMWSSSFALVCTFCWKTQDCRVYNYMKHKHLYIFSLDYWAHETQNIFIFYIFHLDYWAQARHINIGKMFAFYFVCVSLIIWKFFK